MVPTTPTFLAERRLTAGGSVNTTSVDAYLAEGCGRCERYQTPSCKVHLWTEPMVALREVLAESALVETTKWGAPCYTLDGKNVAMLTALNHYCAISFFKGSLLDDPEGMLVPPGPHSQAARLLKFTSIEQVRDQRAMAVEFVAQAIEVERSGRRVEFRSDEPVPDELRAVFDADPAVGAAFEQLTPGRRRSYVLHVSSAKQAKTRASRAERCIEKILAGKGFNER